MRSTKSVLSGGYIFSCNWIVKLVSKIIFFIPEDAPDKDILVPNNPNRCNCIIDRIFTGGLQSDVTCQACK